MSWYLSIIFWSRLINNCQIYRESSDKEFLKLKNHYILNPVSGSLKVRVNKSNIPDKSSPKYFYNFFFDDTSLRLEVLQYRQVLQFLEALQEFSQNKVCCLSGIIDSPNSIKYRTYAIPSARPITKSSAPSWWLWACNYTHHSYPVIFIYSPKMIVSNQNYGRRDIETAFNISKIGGNWEENMLINIKLNLMATQMSLWKRD